MYVQWQPISKVKMGVWDEMSKTSTLTNYNVEASPNDAANTVNDKTFSVR